MNGVFLVEEKNRSGQHRECFPRFLSHHFHFSFPLILHGLICDCEENASWDARNAPSMFQKGVR